jgi:hypothetical protein
MLKTLEIITRYLGGQGSRPSAKHQYWLCFSDYVLRCAVPLKYEADSAIISKPRMKADLTLFESHKIRRLYDDATETWYFSIANMVQVLTQQPDFQTFGNTGIT